MPKIFNKIVRTIKGESEEEYNERKEAEKGLRKEVRSAEFQAKREQAILLAKKRQQIIAQAQERRIRERFAPRPSGYKSSFGGGFIGSFGNQQAPSLIRRKSKPIKKKRKSYSKRIKKKRKSYSYTKQPSPAKFDIIGF